MTSSLAPTRVTRPTAPPTVRAAFLLWMGALAAGAAEIFLHDIDIKGLAVRLGIYAVVGAVALSMRAGQNWARWTLAVGLGVFGTLSLIVEPATWLLHGNSLTDAIHRTDLTGALVAGSRTLHVLCVWIAVPLMFSARAGRYFRRQPAR